MIGGVPTLADQDDFDDCCCEEAETSPGYLLEHASKLCPHLDCDGTADDIYTTPDDSNPTDAYDGKYTRYDGKCWLVTALVSTPGSPTTLTVSGNYATKELCCDPCYNCGNCEFHQDSTVMAQYKDFECSYTSAGCVNFYVNYPAPGMRWAYTVVPLSLNSSCKWDGSWKYRLPDATKFPGSCSTPPDSAYFATEYTGGGPSNIYYNCTENQWYFGALATGISACAGGEVLLAGACLGGSGYPIVSYKNMRWIKIEVSGNSGCDQDGAPW